MPRSVQGRERTLALGILALSIGLFVSGCGVNQSAEQVPTSLKVDAFEASLRVGAFEACMEKAGYSLNDLSLGEPLTAGALAELGLEPWEVTEVYAAEIGQDVRLQRDRCIDQSGISEFVAASPEDVARRTKSALALTECMKGRGWSEFPDPVPRSALYDDGLTHKRIDMPQDPEKLDAFGVDFLECAEEAEALVTHDHDHDHDHD